MTPPAQGNETPDRAAPRWLLVWNVLLLAHVIGAVAWWWIMPGGFPWAHPRFYANRVLPWLVAAPAAIGLGGAWTRRWAAYRAVVLFLPMFWTAALAVGFLVFPETLRRLLPVAGAGVLFLWIAGTISCGHLPARRWASVAVLVVAALIGATVPRTQRGPDPDTHPLDVALPEVPASAQRERIPATVAIGENAIVRTSDGTVTLRCGDVTLEVEPLLRFDDRSPDRCWTILAPAAYRRPKRLQAEGIVAEQHGVTVAYSVAAPRVLRVTAPGEDGALGIEGFSQVAGTPYSHLNTFCELTVQGHRRLSLAFSPCPDARFTVEPADYPTGRPARFAYLGTDERLHVVEARDAEKGPFRELAAGPLDVRQPLVISLFDEDAAVCRIVLEDWAVQCGRTLSPTAGWGVPVNAIQFQRLGDEATAGVKIWVTLADTSVGRGWDSVGHRMGVYRNRMRIEPAGQRVKAESGKPKAE